MLDHEACRQLYFVMEQRETHKKTIDFVTFGTLSPNKNTYMMTTVSLTMKMIKYVSKW